MIAGNWQNNVTKEEYLQLFENKNSIGHIRSSEDVKKLNREATKSLEK